MGCARPPVSQRRIRPGQSNKEKYSANGFVKDLPSGSPQRSEKSAWLCGYRGGAFHKRDFNAKVWAKRFLITYKIRHPCLSAVERLQFRYDRVTEKRTFQLNNHPKVLLPELGPPFNIT